MKRIIALAFIAMLLAFNVDAAQRMLILTNGRDNELEEVNYYLVNGGKVIIMLTS